MKKIILHICVLLFCVTRLTAQDKDLPVKLFTGSDTSKPVIFYISGDGGWNKFSLALAQTLNKNGYTVAGLDAKSYFWEKKTPLQTSTAISAYLGRLAEKSNHKIVFVGYSFGADVLPFIINSSAKPWIKSVVLLSPSTSTDFEIHWSDLLGWDKKRNMDVVAAINSMNVPKVLAIFGDDEKEFPLGRIHLANFSYRLLSGGHHFDGNTGVVAREIIKGIQGQL